MNLRFLETFVCVAQLRSFSATAARLNTTQAAVSNRIATLERDLNTRLFERGKREIGLTASGKKLLDRASNIVKLAGEIESIISAESSADTIKIGATETIVHLWLPTFLRHFQSKHPAVKIDLHVESEASLLRRLEQGASHLAFALDTIAEPSLATVDLGCLECVWFASARTFLPLGRMTIADILALGIVTFAQSSPQSLCLHQLLTKHQIDDHTARIIHCDSLGAMLKLVHEGLGAACLPAELLIDGINDGDLQLLDVEKPLAPLRLRAAMPKNDNDNHILAVEAIELATSVATASGRIRSPEPLANDPTSIHAQAQKTSVALIG